MLVAFGPLFGLIWIAWRFVVFPALFVTLFVTLFPALFPALFVTLFPALFPALFVTLFVTGVPFGLGWIARRFVVLRVLGVMRVVAVLFRGLLFIGGEVIITVGPTVAPSPPFKLPNLPFFDFLFMRTDVGTFTGVMPGVQALGEELQAYSFLHGGFI